MKIGIGNADIPGNQAMRADLDLLLGHDECAVQESEIAHCALAVLSDGKRTTGVTGNVIAKHDCTGFFTPKMPEDLRGLTIESLPKFDIGRDRMRPPVVFHMSILFYVAHPGNFPELQSFA